jgi:6-pyruvoyltetrahydropterin/6-carboxytetrahydropterin synthase
MYTVGVRDHIMVAHSLHGDVFGPAQRVHGATYVVSAEVEQEELDTHGIVCDIGLLRSRLRAVLDDLDYRNLDDHAGFEPGRSTTELIARYVHRELGRKLPLRPGTMLTVVLDESPVAWVKYRAPIRAVSVLPGADLGHA